MDKSFVVFRKVFVHFTFLGVKNAKINFFEENMGSSVGVIKLKCMWLQTGQADLTKTPNT